LGRHARRVSLVKSKNSWASETKEDSQQWRDTGRVGRYGDVPGGTFGGERHVKKSRRQRRRLIAGLALILGLAACGDFIDSLVGSYQPEDRSGAAAPPYLIVQQAPDTVQAQSGALGTIVYVQASGPQGSMLSIRTVGAQFQILPEPVPLTATCQPILPLTAIAVQSPPASVTSLLFVDLMAPGSSGTGTDAGPAGVSDATAATDAAAVPEMVSPSPSSQSPTDVCAAPLVPILSAAAVISNGGLTILDSGAPDGGAPSPEDAGVTSQTAPDGGDGGGEAEGTPLQILDAGDGAAFDAIEESSSDATGAE
jgi:hypothetical protein